MIRDCDPGCDEHYACRLRAKTIFVHGSVTITRTPRLSAPGKPVKLADPDGPSWERQIMGQRGPDGSLMPYLDEHGSPIRIKRWTEDKTIRDAADRLHAHQREHTHHTP